LKPNRSDGDDVHVIVKADSAVDARRLCEHEYPGYTAISYSHVRKLTPVGRIIAILIGLLFAVVPVAMIVAEWWKSGFSLLTCVDWFPVVLGGVTAVVYGLVTGYEPNEGSLSSSRIARSTPAESTNI
jgi:hypothetical protein